MSSTSKRKKWSEVEERTLIDKYGAMVSDGTLAKMKTREKKFKPIALYVNSMYHNRDPVSYPWQWSWKDVSTKVQNMRHQYLLVKQKIKKPGLAVAAMGSEESGAEEFDWPEGPTHWSNFLKYKEVFGDVPLTFQGNDMLGVVVCAARSCGENTQSVDGDGGDHRIVLPEFGNFGHSGDGDFTAGIDGGENGVMALRWCDGEEGEENFNGSNHNGKGGDGEEDGYVFEEPEAVNGLESKRKKKASSSMSFKEFEKKAFGFLANQLSRLKEMEARFELLEEERENERHQRESLRAERERDRSTEREEKEKPSIVDEVSEEDEENDLFFDDEDTEDAELMDVDFDDDEYLDVEEAETAAGDGEAGGGILFAGTWWDNEALSLAEQACESFNGELKIYALRTLTNSSIRVRIETTLNKSGSPSMSDIEAFTKAYRELLDRAEVAKTVPDNLYLEVSSPGVERVVRIPQDLERFKDRPMYVRYHSEEVSGENDGVLRLISYDVETQCCTWGYANVKINREKAGKGRPMNKKQREWRVTTPFESLRLVRLYSEP